MTKKTLHLRLGLLNLNWTSAKHFQLFTPLFQLCKKSPWQMDDLKISYTLGRAVSTFKDSFKCLLRGWTESTGLKGMSRRITRELSQSVCFLLHISGAWSCMYCHASQAGKEVFNSDSRIYIYAALHRRHDSISSFLRSPRNKGAHKKQSHKWIDQLASGRQTLFSFFYFGS